MQVRGECDGESDGDVTDAQPRVQGCISGVRIGRRENRSDGEQRGSRAASYIVPPRAEVLVHLGGCTVGSVGSPHPPDSKILMKPQYATSGCSHNKPVGSSSIS